MLARIMNLVTGTKTSSRQYFQHTGNKLKCLSHCPFPKDIQMPPKEASTDLTSHDCSRKLCTMCRPLYFTTYSLSLQFFHYYIAQHWTEHQTLMHQLLAFFYKIVSFFLCFIFYSRSLDLQQCFVPLWRRPKVFRKSK